MSNVVGTQAAVPENIFKPGTGPLACKGSTNPCCMWYEISRTLTLLFTGPTGRCNDLARAAVRLGFHDAGTWSQSLANNGQDFGGADGSSALFAEEGARAENNGLQDIIKVAKAYKLLYGVGMGDLLQYMAKHATVTCPLGPRIRTFIGRKDATRASLDGLMPDVHASASTLIPLFADKTVSAHDLVALLGAHTAAKQFFVNTTAPKALDTTPGVWDVAFYKQVLQLTTPKGTYKFPSELSISQDSSGSVEWNLFVDNQSHWNDDYSDAYSTSG